jgi:spermidine synthase
MTARKADGFLVEALNRDYGFYLRVGAPIVRTSTAYQELEVFDSPMFGRMLRLDKVFQTSERDEFFYHENICHIGAISHPHPRKALVVGGGDGGAVEELLKHRTMERVVLAELDEGVVEAAKRYLQPIHRGAFADPRLEVRIGDGKAFIESGAEQFDQIVIDLTDASGPSLALYTKEFYRACREVVGAGGIISLHCESPVAHPNTFSQIVKALQAAFEIVRPYLVYVPVYGTLWGMACASDTVDPLALSEAEVDRRIDDRGLKDLQFYNGATHRAVFALPNFVKALLARPAAPLSVSAPVADEVIATEQRGHLELVELPPSSKA